MATQTSGTDLPSRIQELIKERQHRLDQMARIDSMLGRVGAALGGNGAGPGRKPAGASAPVANGGGGKRRGRPRRHRGSFAVTGEESILGFVKSHKNPTNREIEEHWKGEGRGGAAANTLTKLVKDKRLAREPLEGQRGSRYLLP